MYITTSVMQMITPVIIDRIAAALGVNSSLVRAGVSLILPSLINAMASKAATPQGAQAVMGAVSGADPGLFSNLDSMLSGSGRDALISNGTSTLTRLLGGDAVNSMTSALTSKAGLGSGAAAMLLPIVGQMALSGIAKASPGLDAQGLARLLTAQAGPAATASTTTAPPRMPDPPPASSPNFMKWLIPLIILALAAWYFLGSGPRVVNNTTTEQPAATQPAATPPAATPAAPAALTVDGMDIGKTVNDALGTLTATLGTVTNADTAKAALPKLDEVTKSIDGLSAVTPKLSADQKTALGALITAGLPAVKAAADKLTADATIAAVIKPVIDGVIAKIEALAK